MADYEEQMLALQKPLQPDRVVWRVQQSGFSKQGKPWAMVLAYMDNRAVQERFDEVFGRSTVMELLELKGSGASKLLSNLVKADIIEPVSGHGKGRYKFKK